MRAVCLALLLQACMGLDAFGPQAWEEPGQSAYGNLGVSATSIDFGYVTSGNSSLETLVLENLGDSAFAIEDLAIVGDDRFFLETEFVTGEVEPGAQIILSIAFEPDAIADYAGALAISTDLASATYLEVPLAGSSDPGSGGDTGEASTGGMEITRTSVDFGTVSLNSLVSETIQISNDSSEDFLVSDLEFTDSAFDWAGDFSIPYVLRSGQTKTITLNFYPTLEQVYSGVALVSTNDPNQPELEIQLAGEGEYTCGICAPQIRVNTGHAITDFMFISGWGPDERSVTITNEGDMPLNVSNITVNNDQFFPEGTFTVLGFNGSVTLDPWDTVGFTIGFTATASGFELDWSAIDENVVHIQSDDPTQGDFQIALSGIAL